MPKVASSDISSKDSSPPRNFSFVHSRNSRRVMCVKSTDLLLSVRGAFSIACGALAAWAAWAVIFCTRSVARSEAVYR